MNLAILHPDVQNFITNHLSTDTLRLLLGKSPFKHVSTRELVEQIESKKRTEKKIPLWYHTKDIYFPNKLAIEQASSHLTAKYKAQLIKGEHVLDLTGGFGVDSYYFSLNAQQIIHCEINSDLSLIVKHNAKALQIPNLVTYIGDGINYLKNTTEVFSTIYIDPSRRLNTHKVFRIADCEPDVIAHFNILTASGARLIIKTSPLLDITSGLSNLKNVSEIHILSVKNDCKELLWIIDPNFKGADPEIRCVAIGGDAQLETFLFKISEEKAFQNTLFSEPLNFIYEPDVSLLKAGCFKLITREFNIQKLHQHAHLYTSEILNNNFIGRKFKLIKNWRYKHFIKENILKEAAVIARNFPLSVAELKKKHQLTDGGTTYLFFTTDKCNQLIVLQCQRL